MDHPLLAARGPYDLMIANILAGPLIELAPDFARVLVPGGRWCWPGCWKRRPMRWPQPTKSLGLSPRSKPRRGGVAGADAHLRLADPVFDIISAKRRGRRFTSDNKLVIGRANPGPCRVGP